MFNTELVFYLPNNPYFTERLPTLWSSNPTDSIHASLCLTLKGIIRSSYILSRVAKCCLSVWEWQNCNVDPIVKLHLLALATSSQNRSSLRHMLSLSFLQTALSSLKELGYGLIDSGFFLYLLKSLVHVQKKRLNHVHISPFRRTSIQKYNKCHIHFICITYLMYCICWWKY